MKIYLIQLPNTSVIHNGIYSLGLLFMGQYLLDNNIDVTFLDLGKYKSLENYEIPKDGDIYGVSITTPQYKHWLTLIKELKKTNGKIVVGNIHASLFKEQMLQDGADIVVEREGEESLLELIKYNDLRAVSGIIYMNENGDIITNPHRIESDLDKYRFPRLDKFQVNDYEILFCLGGNTLKQKLKVYPITYTRGCPFSCAFCASPNWWDRRIRYNSIRYTEEWIDYLVNQLGATFLWFYDATMIVNKAKFIDVCNVLKKYNIMWRCMTRGNTIDSELIKIMKDSGCVQIDIGVESGSQRMLNILNKGETVEEMGKAVELAHDAGIGITSFLIYGLPGETQEDIDGTINFIKKYRPDVVSLSTFVPFPGCDIANNPSNYRYSLKPKMPSYADYYWNYDSNTTPLHVKDGMEEITKKFGDQIRKAGRDYSILLDDLIIDNRPPMGENERWMQEWKNLS